MRGIPNSTGHPIDYLPPMDAVSTPSSYVPLSYNGGPILSQPIFTTLFWGAFQQSQIDEMLAYLQGMVGYLSGQGAPAGYEGVLRQYGITGALGTLSLQLSTAPARASDADIQLQVLNLQNLGLLPPFNPQRLFLIFTLGIEFDGYGSPWCAYHGTWGPGSYYAICPFPSIGYCGSNDPIASWQRMTSHEIMEAATDPVIGSGWVEQVGPEGADACVWQEEVLPFGVVQGFADNRQQTCSTWTTIRRKEQDVVESTTVATGTSDQVEMLRQLAQRIDAIEQCLTTLSSGKEQVP